MTAISGLKIEHFAIFFFVNGSLKHIRNIKLLEFGGYRN
jgi:hypothetical protein